MMQHGTYRELFSIYICTAICSCFSPKCFTIHVQFSTGHIPSSPDLICTHAMRYASFLTMLELHSFSNDVMLWLTIMVLMITTIPIILWHKATRVFFRRARVSVLPDCAISLLARLSVTLFCYKYCTEVRNHMWKSSYLAKFILKQDGVKHL